jgi:hypothetical protein
MSNRAVAKRFEQQEAINIVTWNEFDVDKG